MSPADAARFAELVDGARPLGVDDAEEAATLMCTTLPEGGDPDGAVAKPKPADIVQSWLQISGRAVPPADAVDFGTAGTGGVSTGPMAAGLSLDPRDLLRMGTVWLMHDRAGTVGALGVSRLVQWVLNRPRGPERSGPRLHLIGHSFGAKVVLSALSTGDDHADRAHSVLLLEPAINRWCFAPIVTGSNAPGGYHIALDRVERPIFSTFSPHDQPLHEVFQLVIRDVGELQIAAVGDVERYGALGGYGPNGLGDLARTLPAVDAGSGHYEVPSGVRVVALDGGAEVSGGAAIKGHGDVSTPVTWWALHELTGPG
jgi:pimeloyl-ACP methyl ester carboxylesterase